MSVSVSSSRLFLLRLAHTNYGLTFLQGRHDFADFGVLVFVPRGTVSLPAIKVFAAQ